MIHNITDRERSLEALVAQLSQGRDALAKRVEALEADVARWRRGAEIWRELAEKYGAKGESDVQ